MFRPHLAVVCRVVIVRLSIVCRSALITDAGHCITFGGGNSQYGQHRPHIFTLDQPTPPETTPQDRTAALVTQDEPLIAGALKSPYRIRKLTWGLGHAIAFVQEKKER
jgi:hypothetical protein